jgi:hypothetical protein
LESGEERRGEWERGGEGERERRRKGAERTGWKQERRRS